MLVLGAVCGAIYGNVAMEMGWLPPEYRLHMVVFAMAGFFTGCVRAPVTAILLLLELTGRFYHLVPLGIVSLFAYAAGELCHDTPIFDAMLEKIIDKHERNKNNLVAPAQQNLLEEAVEGGSPVEGKTLAEIRFPGRALVVSVRRGDQDLIPQRDTRLLAGDYVYLIPNHAKLRELARLFRARVEERPEWAGKLGEESGEKKAAAESPVPPVTLEAGKNGKGGKAAKEEKKK